MGLSMALELKRRRPAAEVVLIEKESALGAHASGRNSGVLHAGFYYTADSFKARFCRDGNRLLTAYCQAKGIPLNPCGKLVVARNDHELDVMQELYRRGQNNGVPLDLISATEARAIEPRAKTIEQALYSPTTASVDPRQVMAALAQDAQAAGIRLHTATRYLGHQDSVVRTTGGSCDAAYVVNAAGLYADVIARDYGFGHDHAIVPFKGLYLKSSEPAGAIKTNIYPVPDLRHPFLGVHFTITATGPIKIGPTAIPAFWREHYGGWQGFNPRELFEVLGIEMGLLCNSRFGFARLALQEMRKYYRPRMVELASQLASGIDRDQYRHWAPPGIRAQLVNLKARKLEMDFIHAGDHRSFHVLNAVSPAFTCALPLSTYLVDEIDALRH
jgi:L-2-hydroxyglutarate oxidase LhgO